MRFNILAGAGQITFPIYKVPVTGGVQPAEPTTMSDIIVAIDGETIPHDATGKCLTALYSDVAEGRHIITVAFAIEERSYVIEYVVRAEIAGYPAVITAPNAYVSLYPETPESIYDTQLSETSKNALQNKVITAVIGTTDLQTLITEAKTIVGAINEIAPHNEGAQGDMLQLNENGEPVWATPAAGTTLDEVPTENSNNSVKSGGVWSFVMAAVETIKEWAHGVFAKMSGNYPDMSVGLADNLTGEEIDVTDGYVLKPLAYDPLRPEQEVADGQVHMTEIRGRAMAWNQLVSKQTMAAMAEQYPNATYDQSANAIARSANNAYDGMLYNVKDMLITNHKYFCSQFVKVDSLPSGKLIINPFDDIREYITTTDWFKNSCISTYESGNKYIGFRNGQTVQEEGFTMHIANIVLIDLTLLFGAGNEPTTVAGVEAYLASRRTLAPYYTQNAGQLLGARFKGWSMPRTLNLLNPTTKQARLPEYAYTGHDNEFTVVGFDNLTNAALQFTPDKTGVAEVVTLDANNRFVIPSTGTLEVVADGGDITGDVARVCVLMTWDGSHDTEYQPFEEFVSDLDSANIYYDDNGTKKQAFDGGVLRWADESVYDSLKPNIVSKKWEANVNVGAFTIPDTWNWSYDSINHTFTSSTVPTGIKVNSGKGEIPCILSKYYTQNVHVNVGTAVPDMNYILYVDSYSFTRFSDSRYSNTSTFKSYITGTQMFYELDSPATHTNLLYKTGENTYVPLEDVLPIDGLQGYGCNWATESLTEMPEDAQGQPQAITPETVEIFQTDMKELLKTIGDTYISKEQAKDSFDGFFTLLNANSGTALGGTYATDGYNDDGSIKFVFTSSAEPTE